MMDKKLPVNHGAMLHGYDHRVRRGARAGGCGCGCEHKMGGCGCGPDCPGCDCNREGGNFDVMFGGAAAIQPMRHRQFAAQMSPQLTARLGRQSSFWNRRRHGTVPRAGTARRGGGLLQWLMGNESESSTSARKTVASRRLRSAGADGNVEPAKDLPIQVTSTESKMLALWDDHAYYTILVLLGLTTPLPDQQTAIFVTRLMQNQDNIGYLFVPRFGKDAANKVAGLLKVHIELAAKVIRANLPSTEGA